MTDPEAALRYRAAMFPAAIFLGSTAYLFVIDTGFAGLFAPRNLVFLVVGMLVAAGAVGLPFFRLQKWLLAQLATRFEDPPSDANVNMLRIIGTLMLAVQVVITFLLAEYLFRWFTAA